VSADVEEHEGESIFASVTDLMVGFLFIFLVLLVFFALDYRSATDALSKVTQNRASILQSVATRLQNDHQPVSVRVDPTQGVLRLPQDLLFAKGSADLTPQGRAALAEVAQALLVELQAAEHRHERVDAVLIEGHTDSDPLAPGGRYADNWDLSAARAIATYHALLTAQPELSALKSSAGGAQAASLFGVAGYGPERPAALGSSEEAKRLNRRIDIRLLMGTEISPTTG